MRALVATAFERPGQRVRERERGRKKKKRGIETRFGFRVVKPDQPRPSLSLSLSRSLFPPRSQPLPGRISFVPVPLSIVLSDQAGMGIGGNDAETSLGQDSATGSNFVPTIGKSIITAFPSIFANFSSLHSTHFSRRFLRSKTREKMIDALLSFRQTRVQLISEFRPSLPPEITVSDNTVIYKHQVSARRVFLLATCIASLAKKRREETIRRIEIRFGGEGSREERYFIYI